LKLDTHMFDECLDRGKYIENIASAMKAASVYSVSATPTVFINGRIVTGVATPDVYARIISEELEQ
jgi:predicted DsbA family dithiol-disulfide isomerase